ncbi:MAG: alpha/beta fold hydrolase [Verrucomicrobiota bacterium]
MKSLHILLLCIPLAFAGCAQYVTVSIIKPERAGFTTKAGDPYATLGDYVVAAKSALEKLDRDPANLEAQRDYNFAVARICGTLRESKLAPWKSPIPLGAHTLAWECHPRPVWNPALYELIPTDELQIEGTYFDVRETKAGLGAPVVARRVADQAHDHAPTPHFFYAATVVARFEGSRCVLGIEDPLQTETIRAGRRTFPLAAGYSAPLAMLLVEMKPKSLKLPRLLHPAKFAASTRIARLEPYDPNKTVVLVVHGLMDSPGTWFPLINRLRAHEDVRRNYQFWFFSYPSGYPYPYSAAILRKELDATENEYPLRRKMVVIGHSMGGCISRLLIIDSGDRLWNSMFTAPPERMDLTPEHKHILTESNIFAHRPEVGRVIFISAPHRGSDLASNWVGRVATRLISIPEELLAVGRAEARYEKHAAGALHLARFPDSVDTLAPNNDFVLALRPIPTKSGIPYHTIAGDRGKGDAPQSSDGVVPYWSSHLPGARSEKVVPSHHSAHQHPEAIEEVHRILTLHAVQP